MQHKRSARAKTLNCAKETVYEKTLRILMTADQDPGIEIVAKPSLGLGRRRKAYLYPDILYGGVELYPCPTTLYYAYKLSLVYNYKIFLYSFLDTLSVKYIVTRVLFIYFICFYESVGNVVAFFFSTQGIQASRIRSRHPLQGIGRDGSLARAGKIRERWFPS